MLSLKRLTRPSIMASQLLRLKDHKELFYDIPLSHHFLAQRTSTRFFDFYKLGSKEAVEKERTRLADEMNRGYFADISELKKHGGKIALANKIIIPPMAAVKFPSLEVNYSDGKTVKLPIDSKGNVDAADADKSPIPKASLICISFRANSQSMINSWSLPFLDAFRGSKDVNLYEISFIDSWLLCRSPIKWLLLRIMKKSRDDGINNALKRQIVYSFGDHYYFRKELKILNLLTGYIFLLDKFGRIRWQGFGLATEEELASLLSCTSLLLEDK
ncbi:ATPase assembly factor ATP [Trema orientale]|uniref:ATPase assembly factor ATP n=1 Tax=Trema orientale TaxID=63057 RepID=A0A2P5DD41_TREOI|nr:ATPase assembly factor ATP [Trema orientale]PON71211.1 ATPase assembly factor ATP [Trema orientale]